MTEEKLVTIASFHNEMEFLLARARLELAELEYFAQDENVLPIAAGHSHIFGGIKLQLRESEVDDASAILRHMVLID
jgi:hypothetical protein